MNQTIVKLPWHTTVSVRLRVVLTTGSHHTVVPGTFLRKYLSNLPSAAFFAVSRSAPLHTLADAVQPEDFASCSLCKSTFCRTCTFAIVRGIARRQTSCKSRNFPVEIRTLTSCLQDLYYTFSLDQTSFYHRPRPTRQPCRRPMMLSGSVWQKNRSLQQILDRQTLEIPRRRPFRRDELHFGIQEKLMRVSKLKTAFCGNVNRCDV